MQIRTQVLVIALFLIIFAVYLAHIDIYSLVYAPMAAIGFVLLDIYSRLK
jgi:hypothetical protein